MMLLVAQIFSSRHYKLLRSPYDKEPVTLPVSMMFMPPGVSTDRVPLKEDEKRFLPQFCSV